ncbi:MAG TPA: carboxypeptidase-like regulatory domain-containing protein, partial [Pyrinomonadaceae bacterium]|nr:carboxypeptidase-like regulatory domain-containing protein [Pyrinomonadaceae bacterium]
MQISRRRVLFAVPVLVFLSASIVCSQTYRGSVRGTVFDPNGAVIPGASIKLTSLSTGEVRTSMSGG